jgi:hypothetical protein
MAPLFRYLVFIEEQGPSLRLVVTASQKARPWHSSPVRIYSYVANGPLCGLLERKVVDSVGPLQCRPGIGPRHGAEGFLSERCVLLKSPIPSATIIRHSKQGAWGSLFKSGIG